MIQRIVSETFSTLFCPAIITIYTITFRMTEKGVGRTGKLYFKFFKMFVFENYAHHDIALQTLREVTFDELYIYYCSYFT